MEISFTSPGWIKEEYLRELGLSVPTCGACLSNMAIAPNGDVVPCQSWLSDGKLGNILTDNWTDLWTTCLSTKPLETTVLMDNWTDIWNSEKCRNIRSFSAMMKGECPLRTL